MEEKEDESKMNIRRVRDALREELDATNTYDRLLEQLPKYKKELEEIRNDEINHQGILFKILCELEPDQAKYFDEGLNGKE